MDKVETALRYKHSGCNCCQAMLLSYADELGMDEAAIRSLGAGFGTGMGCMEGTCGALVGAVMVDGMTAGRTNPSAARQLLSGFKAQCGAVKCADLKGIGTGKVLCSCDDCIANAVKLLEAMKNV